MCAQQLFIHSLPGGKFEVLLCKEYMFARYVLKSELLIGRIQNEIWTFFHFYADVFFRQNSFFFPLLQEVSNVPWDIHELAGSTNQ